MPDNTDKYEHSTSLIDSFLVTYPEYKIHLDEQYHIYPVECETVGEMIQIYNDFIAFFEVNNTEDPIVEANIQDIYDLIMWTKTDPLEERLIQELDIKTESMTLKERRNYYNYLKKNLGAGDINERVDQFIHDEFDGFNEIEHDSFLLKTIHSGLEMLRRHCKREYKYWKNVEDGTDEFASEQIISDTAVKKVILLYELGFIDHLNDRYELENNYYRIGQIMEPLIGEKGGTITKVIRALYTTGRDKNNPKNNPDNITWLQNTMTHLKLKVQEINK
jgi:hypothetical protein